MPKQLMVPSGQRWRPLHDDERRAAIRQGWDDFQFFGWKKDPPFAMGDPRRWLWQNGAEGAEAYRRDAKVTLRGLEGWL